MQILTTTFGLLLILGLIALSQIQKLETINLSNSAFQSQFETTETALKNALQKKAVAALRKLKATTSQGKPPNPGNRLSSTLCITPLLDDNVDSDPAKVARILFKRLIRALYGKKPFFVEAEKECSQLDEKIVAALLIKAQAARKDKKLPEKEDLANLDLEDDLLKRVLYKMLKGSKDLTSEEVIEKEEYYSLYNYINFDNKPKFACIYLARTPILTAIFQDKGIAEEVKRARESMHPIAKDKQEALSEQFRLRFQDFLPGDVSATYINFSVSGSDPRNYDDDLDEAAE